MKKHAILVILMMLCVMLTACSQNNEPVEETVTHTLPPTQVESTEPEWAEVLCDISLVDSTTNTNILIAEDFDTFAVIGTTDADSYIELKVTDEATAVINSMQELNSLQLVVNGETKADIVIDPATFDGVISFGQDMPYEGLCQLASTIRGLY